MRKLLIIFVLVLFQVPLVAQNAQTEILQTIENWDRAWETKDLDLALLNYAEEVDWTNAFGMRVTSKAELNELLGRIFKMDFVMSGENNYGDPDIVFLADDIATARSLNIRKNQKWPDGSLMADRHVAHLRVYKKIDGQWLIVNHMISQAHETEE